jgi:hypothetical protein
MPADFGHQDENTGAQWVNSGLEIYFLTQTYSTVINRTTSEEGFKDYLSTSIIERGIVCC